MPLVFLLLKFMLLVFFIISRADGVDHSKLGKVFKKMGIPDHLACLLRNICEGVKTIVRTRHETMDWFQIGKGVRQGCILPPCLFNLYREYIMRNARLDESQD